jgi:Ca2+-binding EF-hand superfamily protein
LGAIRDAGSALDIVDIDGDGKIGLVDFIRFATRLKARWAEEQQLATE